MSAYSALLVPLSKFVALPSIVNSAFLWGPETCPWTGPRGGNNDRFASRRLAVWPWHPIDQCIIRIYLYRSTDEYKGIPPPKASSIHLLSYLTDVLAFNCLILPAIPSPIFDLELCFEYFTPTNRVPYTSSCCLNPLFGHTIPRLDWTNAIESIASILCVATR